MNTPQSATHIKDRCNRAKTLVSYYSSDKVTVDQLEMLMLSCESRMERYASEEAYVEDAFLLQCMEVALNEKCAPWKYLMR